MSSFQFIASDRPVPEVLNPYISHLSIREAREQGMELPDFLTGNPDIDVDEKVIMICDSEEHLGEIEIRPDPDMPEEAADYTQKDHTASLGWQYSEERAHQLIEWIQRALNDVGEIEIWHIWLDAPAPAEISSTGLSDLTVDDLSFLDHANGFERPRCLVITR